VTIKPTRLIVFAAALLALWGVWGYDLWAPDEPYFGEGAREMVVDGQWAVPHVNGEVTTDKPPLFFWLIALFSLPFGKVLSLTARLPSVLASLGTLWLTMRLGRRQAGEEAGALAGVVLITMYLFWDKARTAQIDALLCFLVLIALSAFESFRAGDAEGRRAGLLFWTAAGLAVLAKGPVGVLLPVGIAVAVLAFDHDLGAWKRFAPWTGSLVLVSIVASWIALATLEGHGTYSVWGAFEKHVLSRAIHGMHHKQPPWYYLTVLPVQLLPWSALVPGAILLAWRRRHDANDRFLLVHAIFVCVFFSIWTEKRDLYVLPAYPAFALLLSRLLVAGNRWTTIPFALTGGLLVLVAAGLPIAVSRAVPGLGVPWLPPAVALTGAGIGTLVAAFVYRPAVTARTLAVGMGAVYLCIATWVYPRFDAIKSARALGEAVRKIAGPAHAVREPVLAYGLGNVVQGIAFYSDGVYVRVVDDLGAIATHLAGDGTAYAVIDSGGFANLPGTLRERLAVSGRFEMSRLEVLIVSNTAVTATSARGAPSNRGRP
jgi:4-amino-4-deoxy-L-arabinose transferase-like glycosyltransferase